MKGKIFNAQDVQAMIAGNKTQFREVIKGAELEVFHPAIHSWAQSPNDQRFYAKAKNDEIKQQYVTTFPFHGIKCPYQVGQKIFAKESFWQFGCYDNGIDGDEPRFIESNKITFCPEEAAKPQTLCKGWKKRPAQHMKQEHSRLTLQIKEINVEKLKDISGEDAINEGFNYGTNLELCQLRFFENWNATHKKPEEKFEASPWVWVISCEVIK